MKTCSLFIVIITLMSFQLTAESIPIYNVMTEDETQRIGLNDATDEQRKAFEEWLGSWTRKVVEQAPSYRQTETLNEWIDKWPQYLSPRAALSEQDVVTERQLVNRYIDKNRNNGAILELRDGSVWKIAEVDRYMTRIWSRDDYLSWTKDPFDVAFPYRLKNETKLQTAYAIMERPPSPSGEKAAEDPIIYRNSIPIKNITVVKTQSANVKKVYPTDVSFELVDGTSWVVAPNDMARAEDWRQGDRIKVVKANDPLYKYRLTNLDTGEEIIANMKKGAN
jgi:hypothetical protein